MMRSADYEAKWIEAAAAGAGLDDASELSRRMAARLRKGEQEYEENGNAWFQRSILDILDEALEENEDAPSWLVLASQRLKASMTLEEPVRDHAINMLTTAAAKNFEAWQILQAAREFVAEETERAERERALAQSA